MRQSTLRVLFALAILLVTQSGFAQIAEDSTLWSVNTEVRLHVPRSALGLRLRVDRGSGAGFDFDYEKTLPIFSSRPGDRKLILVPWNFYISETDAITPSLGIWNSRDLGSRFVAALGARFGRRTWGFETQFAFTPVANVLLFECFVQPELRMESSRFGGTMFSGAIGVRFTQRRVGTTDDQISALVASLRF